jgi:hypothetical protein
MSRLEHNSVINAILGINGKNMPRHVHKWMFVTIAACHFMDIAGTNMKN